MCTMTWIDLFGNGLNAPIGIIPIIPVILIIPVVPVILVIPAVFPFPVSLPCLPLFPVIPRCFPSLSPRSSPSSRGVPPADRLRRPYAARPRQRDLVELVHRPAVPRHTSLHLALEAEGRRDSQHAKKPFLTSKNFNFQNLLFINYFLLYIYFLQFPFRWLEGR